MPRALHVTSPVMAGPDVLALQEKLVALGGIRRKKTDGQVNGFGRVHD